jgi:hypothetical protein
MKNKIKNNGIISRMQRYKNKSKKEIPFCKKIKTVFKIRAVKKIKKDIKLIVINRFNGMNFKYEMDEISKRRMIEKIKL